MTNEFKFVIPQRFKTIILQKHSLFPCPTDADQLRRHTKKPSYNCFPISSTVKLLMTLMSRIYIYIVTVAVLYIVPLNFVINLFTIHVFGHTISFCFPRRVECQCYFLFLFLMELISLRYSKGLSRASKGASELSNIQRSLISIVVLA